MIDLILGSIALGVIALIFYVSSLAKQAGRLRAREQELEEWEGVTDVKRETRDNLNDPEYVKRVRNHFND